MTLLTARPDRIIGNVALASLLAGAPIGVLLTLLAGFVIEPGAFSAVEWGKQLGAGLLLGPAVVFVAGLILIAPALAILRHFGFGGPFFVYAISIVFSVVALADSLRFGAVVLVFALGASFVFCRYAYPDLDEDAY